MTTVVTAVAVLLGALAGSFANVAIHRWPRRGSVRRPAESRCPACQRPIAWYDNVPVVSWLVLRGRCRRCGAPIHWRYPAVELGTAALWGLVAARHGADWLLPALLVLTWVLVVSAAIDLEHRIIPNVLTLRAPLVLAPLLAVALVAGAGDLADARRALIAAVAVPGAMLALSEAFRLVRGQPGIGMGDVKLALSLGLVVGYLGGWQLLVFFYATTVSAVVIAFGLIAAGRARLASRIPYGPYLAVGALTAVVGGDALAAAVAGWFGL